MNLPRLTIYTDNLPPNVGGSAQAFVVKIRPKYKDDAGIHAHEYQHVKQWYKAMAAWVAIIALLTTATYDGLGYAFAPLALTGIGLHGALYLFVRSYRLEAEAQAYAEQVKAGANLDDMAYRLVANDYYKLGITQEQAKVEIQRWITHD
jgi:hypothetical protein